MKRIVTLFHRTVLALLLTSSTADAQSNAFTYQGQLDDDGVMVNGSYDLRFAIFDASISGTQIGSTITNAPVVISNGLFTVMLDFGTGIFTGNPRWLEIGIRTNGSGSGYVIFSQRQPLTPAPYAIHAANAANANVAATANSVATGSISGTSIAANTIQAGNIATGQVVKSLNGLSDAVTLSPGTNITLSLSGNSIAINSSAAGAFIWQTAASTNVSAQAEIGYIITNSLQTTITLPSSLPVGTTIRLLGAGGGGWRVAQNVGQRIQVGRAAVDAISVGNSWTAYAPVQNWTAIASSSDGLKILATSTNGGNGSVNLSRDGGATWLPQVAPGGLNWPWNSAAISEDGSRMIVGTSSGNQLMVSTNAGETWTSFGVFGPWSCVAMSRDGNKLVAGQLGANGQVYWSTNSGSTWTAAPLPLLAWAGVVMSADGTTMIAAGANSSVYISTNSGSTWTARAFSSSWGGVACSSDATKLLAVENHVNGTVYYSTNSGLNWFATSNYNPNNHRAVAMSVDGSRALAIAQNYPLRFSTNFGVNWSNTESSRSWKSVAISASGHRLVAVGDNTAAYVSSGLALPSNATTAGVGGFLVGEPNSAIELIYVGNGLFGVGSFAGGISAH